MFFFSLGILIIILFLVILLGATAVTGIVLRVPFVPSSRKSLLALDQILFQGNEQVCDLGSGNGKILFHLRKKYPSMPLTGYELAILPYLYACIKNALLGTHIHFVYKNFLREDLRSYDIFFCYLMPGVLENTIATIRQQQRHQQLITNTFYTNSLAPEKIIPIPHSRSNLYIYTL